MKRKYEKQNNNFELIQIVNGLENMVKQIDHYYSCLRKWVLTIYDEQAIANDLKAIVG